MLTGQELLNRARSLSNRSEDEIARGCGYVGPSGRVLRKGFYKALVEAKGYKLPSSSSGGGTRGRQADFKTRVHGNGNLLIGHAYTRRLGLEPGQEFRIELRQDSRSIWLLPMNNQELKVSGVSSEQDQDTTKDPG
ncbi:MULTISPECIES: AbrB family transcriptional regulator [unclassified Synechococcus]|uniref:AbrB family transcriptional regulator n=1 Tax=unclassified Synechococcus TaxID=2626047 RepID=UPI0006527CB4|nr:MULTISPECIES: AbrB family transcriptional regulator [unclassified Synechococcus]AKN60997.1 transcriptional regulator [Synechococcus sp. WH 8020]|tara:strand:- start:13 stop:420 length:408 start_codon:yes stop_codon:yes gene_type:complete